MGHQRLIAHHLVVQLAEDAVGKRITLLRPDTNMPRFLQLSRDEFRNDLSSLIKLGSAQLDGADIYEMLLALEEEAGYGLKLDEVKTFKDMIRLQQTTISLAHRLSRHCY